MKNMLLYLLIAHILGDYYLQSQNTADNKHLNNRILYNHLIKYCIPFILIIVFLKFNLSFIFASVIAVVLHGLIDLGKKEVSLMRNTTLDARYLYLFDQGLHIMSLIFIAALFKAYGLYSYTFIEKIFYELGLSSMVAARWFLALILIYKPSNITFMILFNQYKPEEKDEVIDAIDVSDDIDEKFIPLSKDNIADGFYPEINDDVKEEINCRKKLEVNYRKNLKAGGIIGVLEKFLCLILLSYGEFAAVGLVLTAKSIARYDKISKDPMFAEYYLIGTLTSIIMVFLIYILCFKLLY